MLKGVRAGGAGRGNGRGAERGKGRGAERGNGRGAERGNVRGAERGDDRGELLDKHLSLAIMAEKLCVTQTCTAAQTMH